MQEGKKYKIKQDKSKELRLTKTISIEIVSLKTNSWWLKMFNCRSFQNFSKLIRQTFRDWYKQWKDLGHIHNKNK